MLLLVTGLYVLPLPSMRLSALSTVDEVPQQPFQARGRSPSTKPNSSGLFFGDQFSSRGKTVVSELTSTGWIELFGPVKSIITWAESLSAQRRPLPPICHKEMSAAAPVADAAARNQSHKSDRRFITFSPAN